VNVAVICPNFENFCPNNSQFFNVGDVTASQCRTLMILLHTNPVLLSVTGDG